MSIEQSDFNQIKLISIQFDLHFINQAISNIDVKLTRVCVGYVEIASHIHIVFQYN